MKIVYEKVNCIIVFCQLQFFRYARLNFTSLHYWQQTKLYLFHCDLVAPLTWWASWQMLYTIPLRKQWKNYLHSKMSTRISWKSSITKNTLTYSCYVTSLSNKRTETGITISWRKINWILSRTLLSHHMVHDGGWAQGYHRICATKFKEFSRKFYQKQRTF